MDLADRLEADASLDPDSRRHRDRSLGLELTQRADRLTDAVHVWLDRQRAGSGPSAGERAQRSLAAVHALLVLLGALAGAAAALAFFSYDGSRPVNVVQVLAFFVGLQAVLLLATGFLALPEAARRRVPGLAGLQDLLSLASPGRWQPALERLLPPAQRDALRRASGLARRHRRLYGDVQKWSWLVGSQRFAVAFHATALATLLVLVTFSDLAFGWSTTLEVDARRLESASRWLARPWSDWLPEAVPDRALIESTQYFRGTGVPTVVPGSGAWWRFVALCLACYGLAPRLVFLALARWRQRCALQRAFERLPGVAALRDRLESSEIGTAALEGESAAPAPAPSSGRRGLPRPPRALAVRWSGLVLDDAEAARQIAAALGSETEDVIDAGAGSELDDAALVARLAASSLPPVFLVKAWEPPLGELLDLFGELRAALGERAIFVLPVAGEQAGEGARVWARRLDGLGDPELEVVGPGEPA